MLRPSDAAGREPLPVPVNPNEPLALDIQRSSDAGSSDRTPAPAARRGAEREPESHLRVIVRVERPHPGAQLRITDADGNRVTARPGRPTSCWTGSLPAGADEQVGSVVGQPEPDRVRQSTR